MNGICFCLCLQGSPCGSYEMQERRKGRLHPSRHLCFPCDLGEKPSCISYFYLLWRFLCSALFCPLAAINGRCRRMMGAEGRMRSLLLKPWGISAEHFGERKCWIGNRGRLKSEAKNLPQISLYCLAVCGLYSSTFPSGRCILPFSNLPLSPPPPPSGCP